ncbi:DUF6482 family protein [Pseudomonas sp. DWP3-1-2]|jgi:hypothetical protein|uniref:DUF6482 family protein n=1 Tax=Pseudomonas sp. DWP3-1-2 TaxID=2804645 RepID=UPI003CFAF10F
MDLKKLTRHVKADEIQEIQLVTVEGGSYVIHALMQGASHPVQDSHGDTLHVASVEEARKYLEGVPQVPLFLVQPAVYDEMVGLADNDAAPNREPIPFRSSL